jgi:hypothetical protein
MAKRLAEWLEVPEAARLFRPHPDAAGHLLFKEGWILGGVWSLHRDIDVTGTEPYWQPWRPDALDLLLQPALAFSLLPVLLWDRRRWLNANGMRVPRSLWRRASSPA